MICRPFARATAQIYQPLTITAYLGPIDIPCGHWSMSTVALILALILTLVIMFGTGVLASRYKMNDENFHG
jgi:hypothetical protein